MEFSPDRPLAGLLTPLFALRGEQDLGIGDVGALREFVVWTAAQGFGLVQLLPLNETGADNSPYNAISSVALEPTTIEITPEALPDLTQAQLEEITSAADLPTLRAGLVLYPRVKALKRALLERAFENFLATSLRRNDRRARAFREFQRQQAVWLDPYALFRVLLDENGGNERWDLWPEEQRDFTRAAAWLKSLRPTRRRELEQRLRFVAYVQWIAWQQWRDLKVFAEERGVALMGDIPFGVSYYSADVWADPEIFDHRWSGGAPPERVFEADAFTTKWGQNWGVPLFRWEVLRARHFDWWRQRVGKVREIFHFFRVDHILGFYRIYSFPWRPQRNEEFLPLSEAEARARTGGDLPHFIPHEDDTPEHKASNRAQGEEILRELLGVCGAFRLIGEDLGMVPDYVRPSLTALGIAGFKVPQWEVEPDGKLIPGPEYQRLSVATYATHDHEPLRSMWESWMAKIEAAKSGELKAVAARDRAWHECRQLAAWTGLEVTEPEPFSEEVHAHFLRALCACNSWIAVFMITDLFATQQRFNVPGEVSDANWSERLKRTVGEWSKDAPRNALLARVRGMLEETGRSRGVAAAAR